VGCHESHDSGVVPGFLFLPTDWTLSCVASDWLRSLGVYIIGVHRSSQEVIGRSMEDEASAGELRMSLENSYLFERCILYHDY
jgi:hypothetical protein